MSDIKIEIYSRDVYKIWTVDYTMEWTLVYFMEWTLDCNDYNMPKLFPRHSTVLCQVPGSMIQWPIAWIIFKMTTH